MDNLTHLPSSANSFHITELSSSGSGHGGNGTVGPLFVVLAIIIVLGVVAGFIGRVCAGRHWGGDTQYDFEGWVEKRCASCIDGDIEAPPPLPPPPEKPPDATPPADAAPPPADAAAPPPADGAPPPAEGAAAPPAADAAAAAPAGDAAPPGEAPAAPPAEAPAPDAPPPAEAAPPPPSEPLPPPPPPLPPPQDQEAGGVAAAYVGSHMEPLDYSQLYPSYSCRCHICAREGIFE
ncbi:hypothetical protein GOP47_0024771 [Adiantum capillus-veneris]|uniref:Uncharacterized protein n=1 Tax=Adiantum capillus-veneris TaxID=13818 RepID=A0A9D4U2D4_ADICA|nr:hypothetical protein GOP47_0024771 [Adiantum capillus-veneris]